ncbi:MAG: winged helix-turn-helix transcriptional regulator [Deltaproteobacteria bacterium]|nr:winged helix-turn-helix transcriptional regulator [Deltaproteobacteria bacterium]
MRLLDAIEQDGQVSQRNLSKRLGVSLGLTNHLIRRSIRDGYFEVHVLPPKHSTYVLTMKGRDAKSRLTTEYIAYCFKFYRDIRKTIQKRLRELENDCIQAVIFYGAGETAELLYHCLYGSSINLVGIIDRENEGGTFFGHPICSPEDLSTLPEAAIFITTMEDCDEKIRDIRENGGSERMVFDLLSLAPHQFASNP